MGKDAAEVLAGRARVLTASERRKRLKLKRIVISEHNYVALKELGHFHLYTSNLSNRYFKYGIVQ